MGTCFLDGQQIGDGGRCGDLPLDLLAELMADRAEREARGRATMDAILADMRVKGRQTRKAVLRSRVRAFQTRPATIDMIPGLAPWSTPEQIVATASSLLDRDPSRRGEVSIINLQAALLYGRWLRRLAHVAARIVEAA